MTDHDLDLLVHRMFNHPPVIESFDQQCRQQVEMITQSLKIPTTIGEMFSRLRAIWRAGFREGAKTMERYRVEIAEQQAALDELKQRRAVVEKREQALDRKPKPEPTEAEMREFSRPCADCLHCSTPGDPAATCGHPRCLQIDPVTGVASRPRCVEVRQAGDRCGTRGHYFVPRATPDAPRGGSSPGPHDGIEVWRYPGGNKYMEERLRAEAAPRIAAGHDIVFLPSFPEEGEPIRIEFIPISRSPAR